MHTDKQILTAFMSAYAKWDARAPGGEDDLHHAARMFRDSRVERLEYLRGELRAERISYDEIHELQSLARYIEPGDTELLEAAGVPESDTDDDQE